MHDARVSEARDRVIATALRMFSERGYAAVSMRDLAKELNIQAPSIYSHFPSKEALLVATVVPMFDELDAVIAQRPTEQPVSLAAQRDWIARYMDFLRREWLASRFTPSDREVLRHPELRARLLRCHQGIRDVLRSFGVDDDMAATGIVGFLCWPLLAPGVDIDKVYRDPAFLDNAVRLTQLSRRAVRV